MSGEALLRAGMGAEFAGVELAQCHPLLREALEGYCGGFAGHVALGRGLAIWGGQGTGKTAGLALIAEAAHRWLEGPEPTGWETAQWAPARYVRMPRLVRYLGDFLPASERAGWDQRYRELCRCGVLLIDEAQAMPTDRGCALLLDLIDERVSTRRPVCLAMNADWQALRDDQAPLLRQIREKLEAGCREVAVPGESRRRGW